MGPKGNVKISMDGKAAYPRTFLYFSIGESPKNYQDSKAGGADACCK